MGGGEAKAKPKAKPKKGGAINKGKKIDRPLTDLQRRFVAEYMVDPKHMAECYVRAGGSPRTASAAASRLLKDVKIQRALAGFQRSVAAKLEITPIRVLSEYAKLAFRNLLDYMTVQSDGSAVIDLSRMTRDQAAAISEMTVETYVEGRGDDAQPVKRTKIRFESKDTALRALAENLGLFQKHNEQLQQQWKEPTMQDWDEFMRARQEGIDAVRDSKTAG